MKNRYLRLVKKQRGFTLIELLAVILILGIIALIAIPTVNNVVKQARKGASESTGNQIINSTEQFYTMCTLNGGYDKNGNKCPDDLRGTLYSSSELSDVIGIKGDFPDISDFVVYKKNPDGTAAVVYRKDSFACSNQVDESGNISYKYTGINNPDGVKCTEKKISGSGNVLLQTDGTKHVMKSYKNVDKYFYVYEGSIDTDFRADSVRNTIYEIKFINHINIPESVSNDKKWDVSEAQDGSIMAWLEPVEEGSSLNTLYIGSFGSIYANPSSGYLFSKFHNLTSIYFGNFNTDDVISMQAMFMGNPSLSFLDVSSFKTSNVKDMSRLFAYYIDSVSKDWIYLLSLEEIIGLENWDTSNVTDMYGMFDYANGLLELDLSNWDVGNVEDFSKMFASLDNLKYLNIDNWNTSKAKDMSWMFGWLETITELDLSRLNTSSVETMQGMFYESTNLKKINLSGWNTSKVTDMSYMFYGLDTLTELDLSEFDTSNVTDMSFMFGSADISNNKVIDENDAYLENIIGIENLNTSNVTDMMGMFTKSKIKNLDLSKWNTSKVTNMSWMFYNSKIEDLNLTGWSNNVTTNMSYMFYNMLSLKNINLTNFKTPKVTNMARMFSNDYQLTTLNLSGFTTNKVTDMSHMFENTIGMTEINMTGWNTGAVKNMSYMFAGGAPLSDDNWQNTKDVNYIGLNSFDTHSVTNFQRMFYRSGKKNLSLTNFNTSAATNIAEMFRSTYLVTLDISSFNTSNVTNATDMFIYNASLTTIYVGTGWNTSKMGASSTMFSNCGELVGAVKYNSSKTDLSMANYTNGYLTLKS